MFARLATAACRRDRSIGGSSRIFLQPRLIDLGRRVQAVLTSRCLLKAGSRLAKEKGDGGICKVSCVVVADGVTTINV